MKRLLMVGVLLIMLFSMTGFAPASWFNTSGPQNYTVLVGSENTRLGVSIMSFFPGKVTVHVGDTVTWKANSHEFHTVSFLAPGQSLPDFIIPYTPPDTTSVQSPLQANPLAAFPQGVPSGGVFDPSIFENSGLMGLDPGQVRTFSLVFNQPGTYSYICIIHGKMMTGEIDVVGRSTPVASPGQVRGMTFQELAATWSKVPGVISEAVSQIVPPAHNPDGTTTHTVLMGYESGTIMLMRFFPKRISVDPGDTIVWKWNAGSEAPHTITFFNGTADQQLVIPVPQPNGSVALVLNPAVLFPSPAAMAGVLDKTSYVNSGIIFGNPVNEPTFTLKVGDISGLLPYECQLHDTSGMQGSVYVR